MLAYVVKKPSGQYEPFVFGQSIRGADLEVAEDVVVIGKDAADLARAAGKTIPPETELIFGETAESSPFVEAEQMMPFIPFVRARDVDHAIEMAVRSEHGFRHTAVIHSRNVDNMTKMGRLMDTTLFIKNGPCMSALGVGGEGYLSFSIATPTGEGVTTPLTFTRERRCSLIDDLCILGRESAYRTPGVGETSAAGAYNGRR